MENKCIHGGKFEQEIGYPCKLYKWCDVMKKQDVCSDYVALPVPENKEDADDGLYLPVEG